MCRKRFLWHIDKKIDEDREEKNGKELNRKIFLCIRFRSCNEKCPRMEFLPLDEDERVHTHRRILCFPLWSNGKFATSQEWIVRVLKNRALSKWCLANCELLWVLTQRRYQQQHQQQPQKMRIIHSNGANSSNMCMANSFLLTHETTLVYLSVVLWHILCMPFSIARLAHSHCGYAQYCVL